MCLVKTMKTLFSYLARSMGDASAERSLVHETRNTGIYAVPVEP